jgi:hypothetical protein
MSISITQVWSELEATFRKTFSDKEHAAWLNLVLAHMDGKMSLDSLVSTMREVLETYDVIIKPRQPLGSDQFALSIREAGSAGGRESRLTRHQILTEFIRDHADQNTMVRQFREEELHGKLLEWEGIQAWITQQRQREIEQELPRLSLDVPLPPSSNFSIGAQGAIIPDPPISVGERHPAKGFRRQILEYAMPNSTWVECLPIAYGGTLARLQQLSIALAGRYAWQPAHGTVFVLTGLVPVLQPIRYSAHWSSFQTPAGTVTALCRIELMIDPTLTPQEVSTAFQRIRQRLLGSKWRDLKERQLKLAQFALSRRTEEPWPQQMEAWNEGFEEGEQGCYDNVGNFKRACLNAIKRLLTPIVPEDFLENFTSPSEDRRAESPRQL